MKHAYRRILALVLAIVLLAGILPAGISAADAAAGDPKPILYLDMESVTEDGKLTNKADGKQVQILGAYAQTTAQDGSKALSFDGSTAINVGRDYQVKTAFTAAAWVKVSSGLTERAKLFGTGRTAVSDDKNFNINIQKANKNVWWEFSDTSMSYGQTDPNVVAFDAWQHVVLTADQNNFTIYVNCAKVLQKTVNDGWTIADYSTDMLVGAGWNKEGTGLFANHCLKGELDEVRLYDIALSAKQVSELYAFKTPEEPETTDPQPILYLDMETVSDENTLTNKADGEQVRIFGTWAQTESKNGSKALSFDGKSTGINAGRKYQVKDALTVAAWVKADSTMIERAKILGTGRSGVQGEPNINVNIQKANKNVWWDFTGMSDGYTDAGSVTLDEWQHIALTADQNELAVYVNGEKILTRALTAGWSITDYATDLLIGATFAKDGTSYVASHFFKGAMDELRLYDAALTAEQVKTLATVQTVTPDPDPDPDIDPDEDDPYIGQDGEPVYGLKSAIIGKRHWLENTESMPVTVSKDGNELKFSNGAISRTFALPEKGGTNFYTKSYKNTYINKELMDGKSNPEVYLGLYNRTYGEVYDNETIKVDPDYYYVGGTRENTFVFDGYELFDTCEKPFEWTPRSKSYSDPAASNWPPKGKRVEFSFSAPDTFPEDYQGLKIKVIYEMYDNCAVMKKRVEITNTKDNTVMIGRLAPEVLSGGKNMDDLLYFETTYVCGAEGTIPVDNPTPCLCGNEKDTSAFLELADLHHTCYDLGPAYELSSGGTATLKTFDTYELVYSTYWFEWQSMERLGFYRKLFPWITDNPITLHYTGQLTKSIIDHAAAGGVEMIIQSYGVSDPTNQMLTRNKTVLDNYKALIDYAHSKGVDIGIYQAQYTRSQYKQGTDYGTNSSGKWNTWCLASAAFDDYYDNFKYFVEYTGIDCVEIDGPYPGCVCTDGESHVNADKETNPADPTDTTTGKESKYAFHKGYFDSKVKQWENAVRLLCKDMRDMDVYIKVPAWYYLSGGNKCGIGYEERAWSQPRQEQLIYARQLIYNASYVRTMSMSWSHFPFQQYQGGGSAAAFQPFYKNLFDYNWNIAQHIGNGITSDYRGNAMYDEASLPYLQYWMNFFNRYRGIVNSDMVHITQAKYEDDPTRTTKLDTLYHVNANNSGEKGLLWVYNQSDEERTETITVPMYYTGLTNLNYPADPVPNSMGVDVKHYGIYPPNYNWLPKNIRDYSYPEAGDSGKTAAFVQDGVDTKILSIDSNGNVQLKVTLQPMSFTYFAIYAADEVPSVSIRIDAVTGLTAESQASGDVKLVWDANPSFTVTENGKKVEKPAQAITGYQIYRDGQLIGQSTTAEFTDTTAEEYVTYKYEVTAVISSVEGAKAALSVTTTGDAIKPELASARAASTTSIVLTFTKAMDQTTAETVNHYTLSGGKSVRSASLSEDGKTLTLTVDALTELESYTLSISGLIDATRGQNPLDDCTCTVSYGYLLYLPMDGVEADTLENMAGTSVSAPGVTYTSATGKNGCAYLNATDKDYADLGAGLVKGLDTYTLSFSVWAADANKAGTQAIVSAGQEEVTAADFGVYLESGKLVFRTGSADGTKKAELTSDAFKPDTWNQITVVRSGETFTLYVNGEKAAEQTVSGIGTLDSLSTMYLGAMTNHAGGDKTAYFGGRVDELMLCSTARTAEAVRALAQSYQAYTNVKPMIALDFESVEDGKLTNKADGKQFPITDTSEQGVSQNGSKSMKFTGTNYANLGNEYQLGGEWTAASWINVANTAKTWNNKLFGRGYTQHAEGEFYTCIRNNGYNIAASNMDNSGSASLYDYNKSYISANTWVHFAVVCDGTTVKVYLNGVLHGTQGTANNLNLAGNPRDLLLGGGWNQDGTAIWTDHMFKGEMDEVYLYDAALSQSDITALMNRTPAKEHYTVTLPTGEGYTAAAADGSVSPVEEGGSYSFTVTVSEGYHKDSDFAVKANGQTLTEANGVYTISDIREAQAITVVGVSKDEPIPVTADKSALQKLYDDNKNRKQSDYESGWDAFDTAMREAETVLADADAAQEAVDAAKATLEAAIAGLKEKSETPVQPDDPKPVLPPYYPIHGNGSGKTDPSRANRELPFTDVSKSDWFYDSVKGAWQNYLIDGVSATTYKPAGTLTVAEAIKLAAALHQLQNTGKVTLTNGKINWYDSYVEYGIANGILDKSCADYTRAQMNAPATRREFVHIFFPAMDSYKAINSVADNAIPDVKLGDKCAEEIYAFYRAGILTGSDKQGSFRPDSTIVRSEVAAILYRMFEPSARKTLA